MLLILSVGVARHSIRLAVAWVMKSLAPLPYHCVIWYFYSLPFVIPAPLKKDAGRLTL